MTTPRRYVHGHHESVLRAYRWRSAENSAAYVLDEITPGAHVLDVGCGPGSITVDFARRCAPGRVLGIDLEPGVLDDARRLAREAGLDNVEFKAADVYATGLPDASFDVVHAHQLMQHLADPPAALREMGRLARPGGVVAARDADYAAMTWYPLDEALDRWLSIYHEVARASGGEPDAARRLYSWALEAGLSGIECSAGTWCFATPEDRAWWGGSWAERVVASRYAEQVLAGGFATRAELEEIAAAWRRWVEAEDGWFVVVHGQILARV